MKWKNVKNITAKKKKKKSKKRPGMGLMLQRNPFSGLADTRVFDIFMPSANEFKKICFKIQNYRII